jgi:hypothetical protein
MDQVLAGPFVERLERSQWTTALACDLLNAIGDQQKKLLAVLYRADGLLRTSLLVERMCVGSKAVLGGIIGGLSVQLRSASINSPFLCHAVMNLGSKNREHLFGLTDDFRQALTEIGWPDAGKAESTSQFVATSPKKERKAHKMRELAGPQISRLFVPWEGE